MQTHRKVFGVFILTQFLAINSSAQSADIQQEAIKLLSRISGVKVTPTNPLVAQIAARLQSGDYIGAAAIAETDPNFYNITVKEMALKMSTKEHTIRQPLNDFAAMFVGATRDDLDARTLFTGNYFYMASDPTKLPTGVQVRSSMLKDLIQSNNHFQDLDIPAVNLASVLVMVNGQQIQDNSGDNAVAAANPDPAGVLTSRAFLGSATSAGTNRRASRETMEEFLCSPIQDWGDTRAPNARVGRDVDRNPGGDHMVFVNTCSACHAENDGLRGAFAYWDFNGNNAAVNAATANPDGGSFSGTGNHGPAQKMNKNNNVFKDGFVTVDNSFVNFVTSPTNSSLFGWRGANATGGMGVHALGKMISDSKRFSQCMVKRVYDAVCRTDIDPKQNLAFITQYGAQFESEGYNLKKLFQEMATTPMCQGN